MGTKAKKQLSLKQQAKDAADAARLAAALCPTVVRLAEPNGAVPTERFEVLISGPGTQIRVAIGQKRLLLLLDAIFASTTIEWKTLMTTVAGDVR